MQWDVVGSLVEHLLALAAPSVFWAREEAPFVA